MKFIRFDNVDFKYGANEPEVIKGLTLDFEQGQFVAVLGRNGSGKSTMAKLINALLEPVNGVVITNGYSTVDEEHVIDIRKSTGMVFQNPDNQIFSSVIEEDVAFGLENIGYKQELIEDRVKEALGMVGMEEYAKSSPSMISGGQKQRIAIAGVMAMNPKCIVLDEATAMLDPIGRKSILEVVRRLNREEGITVIHITHHMNEAILADRVVVVDKGRVVLDGAPTKVFANVSEIKKLGLDVPQVSELFYEINQELGEEKLPMEVLEFDRAVEEIERLLGC